MNKILFRGKRLDNGEWVEGFFVCCKSAYDDETGRTSEIIPYDADRIYKGEYSPYDVHEVIFETVGQFTGLTDKNGTKIFVGDVIKTDNGKQKAISVVKYGNFRPKMIYHMFRNYIGYEPKQDQHGVYCETANEQMVLFDSPTCIEVIGNIHDNPELLEG